MLSFEPMRVAVGSRNPTKIEAVQVILSRLGWPAEVLALVVASGVRAQPLGEGETRRGALARARLARRLAAADLGVGMETGVAFRGGGAWLVNWVAVVAKDGRCGLGRGLSVELPPAVARAVRAGRELGEVMDELTGKAEGGGGLGAVGVVTAGLVGRQTLWEGALAAALAPFLRPDLYRG